MIFTLWPEGWLKTKNHPSSGSLKNNQNKHPPPQIDKQTNKNSAAQFSMPIRKHGLAFLDILHIINVYVVYKIFVCKS